MVGINRRPKRLPTHGYSPVLPVLSVLDFEGLQPARVSSRVRGRGSVRTEDGFTLIELLVAMVVGIIVLGGGTYGIARAFQQSTNVIGRASSSTQAEAGIEVLIRDLREATICPTATYTSAAKTQQISGVLFNSSGGTQTLQMCDPTPGLPQQAGTDLPQTALITWTCSASAAACSRTFASISESLSVWTPGTSSASTKIVGISSVALSGIVGGGAAQSLVAGTNYALTSLSWVGISAEIASLSTAAGTAVKNVAPIQIQTGTALENFGT